MQNPHSIFVLFLVIGSSMIFSVHHIIGQDPVSQQSGDRFRVSAEKWNLKQRVVILKSFSADSLFVSEGAFRKLPLEDFERIEISTGNKSKTLLGTGIGLLAGAGIGFIIGSGPVKDGCNDGECVDFWVSTLSGGIVGVLAGMAIRGETWKDIPLEEIRMELVPYSHVGTGLGVVIRFK